MINMFDMLNQAQNGAAMDNLSRQFGLHPDQTRQAVEALMPAFNEGMRRQAQSLEAMQDFFGKLGSGSYERYFEEPEAAESEDARDQGNDILSQMFGSKDVSKAVADQAAAMTGMGNEMFRQMLPIVASMIQMAVSRAREYSADETGARNCRDPEALASALQKLALGSQSPRVQAAAKAMVGAEAANHLFIVNPLAGGPGRWFASHPPVEERVARLRGIGRDIGQIF